MHPFSKKITRRQFMAAAGGTVVSIGLPGRFVKAMDAENQALAKALRPDGRLRIPPGQRAVKALVPMGGQAGKASHADWTVQISGEIETPMTFTLQQLNSLKPIDLTCDVHCVTGWSLLDSNWRGVSLQTIIDAVHLKATAKFVIFEAPQGYTSNIPLHEARKGNVILATGFENNPLPTGHGAPIRALVPDLYFWKSVKWVKRVRFTAIDEPGFYEQAGYSNTADPWKEERFQD